MINKIIHGVYPFWFWNGEQTKPEIDRQLTLALNGGFKGLAIHSRVGNRIPYLSERWIELVRHACCTARRLGLKIWLYDEDGFPSGTVGNRIQTEHPELRQQYLRFQYLNSSQIDCEPFACFETEGYHCIDPDCLPENTDVLVFSRHYLDRYVDTMKPETTELFIKYTHERYYEELTEFFGDTIECIYTDDIDSKMVLASGLPWTDDLDALYQSRYGESLLNRLPLLVEDLSGCEKTRINFRKLVQDLFLNNFVRPVANWCTAHNVVYTGHLSGDEGPLTRTVSETGAIMPFQRLEHIPGIDDYLSIMDDCRYLKHAVNKHSLSALRLFKSGASVAHQQGHGLFSCECMAGTGWDFTMAQQDRQMLFEIGMGVNLITPHAAYYTVGGPGKTDFPPSYFFQQPYWPLWREMADKWTRSAALLQRGRFQCDTLLIYPSSSAWARQNGGDIIREFTSRINSGFDSVSGLENEVNMIMLELLRMKVGFDILDETDILACGDIEAGSFRVGSMLYSNLLVPAGTCRDDDVLKHLSEIMECGVNVIFMGKDRSQCSELLTASLVPDIQLLSPKGDDLSEIFVHARITGDRKEFFLLNLSDSDKSVNPVINGLCLYDPEDDVTVNYGDTDKAFSLPAWNCCFLLSQSPSWTPPVKDINATRFANQAGCVKTPVTLVRVDLEQKNTALLQELPMHTGCYEFSTSSPIMVSSIYSEAKLERIRLDGCPVELTPVAPHSCDPCFFGAEFGHVLPPGVHRLETENCTGPLRITGDFSVSAQSGCIELGRQDAFSLGDLSQQGLAFYHGAVNYDFQLDITAPDAGVRLDLGQVVGAVELYVNGKRIDSIFSPPYAKCIGAYLKMGRNHLRVVLYNTAQNLIGPEIDGKLSPASFGIYGPVTSQK